MNNIFKIKYIEVILILLIFCIINILFANFFIFFNQKYKEYLSYLYPINYLLSYLTLFYFLIYFWKYYKNESLNFQYYEIQFKDIVKYIILFLFYVYITHFLINILSHYTSKLIIYLNNFLKIKYNISIKNYVEFIQYNLKKNFHYLYRYPISACITIGFIAPIMEEILFRGIILQGLINYGYKKWNSLIFSSFIFGILHINFWQIISAFILGIIIGWIYIRSQSLILSIILHIINNLSICLFYLFCKSKNKFYIENAIVINLILLILFTLNKLFIQYLIKRYLIKKLYNN